MAENKKIKILCLTGQLGNGGSEKQLYLFLKHLDKGKYEPSIVVSSSADGIWHDRIRSDISCEIVSLGRKSAPVFKLIKFRMLLNRFRPDLVLCWNFYVNAYSLAGYRRRFIGCLRGELEAAKKFLSPIHFKLCYLPSTFMVNSELLRKEVVGYGYPADKVFLINNMFEMNPDYSSPEKLAARRIELRKSFGVGENEILVAGAGRNAPEKDFHFFVHTIAKACASKPGLKGLLIGKGGSGVKQLIDELGLSSRFIITGEVPYAKDIFPCADIFFLSSKYEDMPNVMLEAVDARCATLAMDVGGVRDILGEDNPYLDKMIVGARNADKASRMLVDMAGNSDLRSKISQYNAARRLACFTHEKMMPKYYGLFEHALAL